MKTRASVLWMSLTPVMGLGALCLSLFMGHGCSSGGGGGGGSGTGGKASSSGGSNGSGGSSSGGSNGSGGSSSGGSNGSGGSSTGGSNGSGGAASGGSGGGASGQLQCSPGVSPAMALLTDFGSATWNNTAGKWGTPGNLTGAVYSYGGNKLTDAGMATALMQMVDTTAMNTVLSGTVAAGDYGGGGLSFDSCVNTTTYTGVQFTLGGTTGGCDVYFQVQTFVEQGIANKGGCDPSAAGASCYSFPQMKLASPTGMVTVHFSDLAGGMPTGASAIAAQIVGLQWQFQSAAPATAGGPQTDCTGINLTIDDVQFVSN